ncbi:MAG TPA: DUF2934 domain-containing protein [Opitutaceae bacterium]|jgi:hypothetical protein|nr:DUF2934 domain-containing protein [Opitutaceae bacterium]
MSSSTTEDTAAGLRPTQEEVAQRAYEIWQSEGAAHGRDQDHWLQAEGELASRLAQAGATAALNAPGPASALPAGSREPRRAGAPAPRANPPGGRRRF